MPEITLSKSQSKFFNSTEPANAFVSGFGSGKSYVLVLRMIATKLQYPELSLLYCAPTFSLIRDVLLPLVEEILYGTGIKWKFNRSDNDIIFDGHKGKILCRSMDSHEKIIGFTIYHAFLDELDTLPTDKAMNIWHKCLGRMRAKARDGSQNQMFVATTPEGFRSVYQLFKKEPVPEGYKLIQSSTYENKANLPDGFIQNMESAYPPELIKAYLSGEFVNLSSGAVYLHYNPELHDCSVTIDNAQVILCGQDFNFEGCVTIVFLQVDDCLFAVDEIVSKDTYEVVENLKRYKRPVIIYPDASSRQRTTNAKESDVSILKRGGFRVKAFSKNPPIQDRVNAANALFIQNRLFINADTCPELHSALLQQVYSDGTGLPEKSHKPASVDDFTDALGYLVSHIYPLRTRRAYKTALVGL